MILFLGFKLVIVCLASRRQTLCWGYFAL